MSNYRKSSLNLFSSHNQESSIQSVNSGYIDHYSLPFFDGLILEKSPTPEPAKADKWLAISSLHKSIRRGEIQLAYRATATLLSIDPSYLFRRLPVIAYEDIGIANPTLCSLTLYATKSRVQDAIGKDLLAYSLVQQMASSEKSRTATDVFCTTLSDPYALSYLNSCLRLKPQQWVNIAADTDLCLTHRMAAIRLITGYSIRLSNGYTKSITKPDIDLLHRLCENLKAAPQISHLAVMGHGKTLGLNGAILLAHEILSNSLRSDLIVQQLSTDSTDGVLHCAYDQYCRAGKQVIASLLSSSEALRAFFEKHPVNTPTNLMGVLLFQLEGCLVDKQLDFNGMLELQQEVEAMELTHAGLKTNASMQVLKELLQSELPNLQKLRQCVSPG